MHLYRKLFAAAIALSLFSAQLAAFVPQQAQAAVADWQKGATMVPRWTADFGSDSFKQSLTNLRNTGASAVALVVPYYQSNTSSTDIAPGWNTPTDDSLAAAIDQAHALGMSVNLKMLVESYDGSWRAYINPGDRDGWFAKYNQYLVHLAQLAQSHHVELITIGTEMVSMAASSQNGTNTAHWQQMIANVRAAYSGKLTYGANSNDNSNSPFTDEKRYIGFWGSLDYAGISAYYTLNSGGSVDELKGAWDYWNNNDLRAFQASVGKPLLFAEIGYRSVDGAHYAPWDWGRGGGVNQGEQANDYEATMSYWNDYPYVAGIYWWDWSTDPNAGGNNTDYTPQNKQAQQVMQQWFTTPSAPGNPGSGAPAFGSTGSTNPGGTMVGSPVALTASVQNVGGAASNLLVDLEVYDQSNNKVFQQYYDNQSFAVGETRNFPASWTPQAAGTYRMTIGVFSNTWSTAYHWNDNAAQISVSGSSAPPPATTTPPTPPPAAGNLNIWWPTDGTHVSGVQPLKAMVEGMDVSQYQMYWQVDGGALVAMADSAQEYPHKEAWVDYSQWRWSGHGPYTLTFVAKQNGAVIAQKSVQVTIDY